MNVAQQRYTKFARIARGSAATLVVAAFASSAVATSGALDIVASTKLKEDHTGVVTIAADGVTLNCNGHQISAPGADYAIVIVDRVSVTVKNCRITNTTGGMLVSNSTDVVIKDNSITDNALVGLVFVNMTESTVKDNLASNNGGEAFHFEFSSGNTIKDNTATGNGVGAGGFFSYLSNGNLFKNNHANGHGLFGFFFLFSVDNLVKENFACSQPYDLLVTYDEAVFGLNEFKRNSFCAISQ